MDNITDKAEFHWVWAYQAPAGYQFEPVGKTDQDVKGKMQTVANMPNHADGKEKAKRIGLIEYVARPTGGRPDAFIDRMFVVSTGATPPGLALESKSVRECVSAKTRRRPVAPLL